MKIARRKQEGIAIITAILIMAIIASVALALSYGQQLWLSQAQNLADLTQAELLHNAAMETAALALKEDARKTKIDYFEPREELWNNPAFVPIEKGTIAFKINDAQGKFNLNTLVNRESGKANEEQKAFYKRLLRVHEIDAGTADELVDSLIDWIDPNNETEPRGAEDPEYLAQNPPYRAANRLLTSVEELRLVKGYTAQILEKIKNDVVVLPPAAVEININTSSGELLAAFANISLNDAKGLLARVPYKTKEEFEAAVPGGKNALKTGYDTGSSYFIVAITVQVGRVRRETEGMIERSEPGPNPSAKIHWQRLRPLVIDLDPKQDSTPDPKQNETERATR